MRAFYWSNYDAAWRSFKGMSVNEVVADLRELGFEVTYPPRKAKKADRTDSTAASASPRT